MDKIDNNLIDNVDLKVEAFLGGTDTTIEELNKLIEGKVLELDQTLNEKIELRVNGLTIALGELVSVGNKFGVRITEIST